MWLISPLLRLIPAARRTISFRVAAKAIGGAVLGAALGTQVVVCRPLDTPDYLLPYYLRDTRSRFAHYASIKKKNGNRFMTAEDFVCALLASKDTTLEDPTAVKELEVLFAATDANHDGKLSFSEFSFLMMLLTTKARDFELSFSVFDDENKGSLNLNQFEQVVASLSDDDGDAVRKLAGGGILKKLFGPEGQGRCSYDSFRSVVDQIQTEVWKAEFMQCDPERCGNISVEKFGQLIASQMLGSHLPFYLVGNLRRLREVHTDRDVVPMSSWIAFHKIMQHADQIGEAIELFTANGAPLLRKDFRHAIAATGLPPLSDAEINLVYCLFDRNGDGALEYDEFLSIMRDKMTFHHRQRPRDKVSFFERLEHCTVEGIMDGVFR
mmetsp:Transcript_38292/g.44613  ORF Transcript_38292/g.44613 Transcript_38292/m.44613 type:complete len:381 (-) Transcript_38292:75-1217(-)